MEIKLDETTLITCDMCNAEKPQAEVEKVWCCSSCKCMNNEPTPKA